MTTIKIALDWTPNINHFGILAAREMDFMGKRKLMLRY